MYPKLITCTEVSGFCGLAAEVAELAADIRGPHVTEGRAQGAPLPLVVELHPPLAVRVAVHQSNVRL